MASGIEVINMIGVVRVSLILDRGMDKRGVFLLIQIVLMTV